MTSPHPMPRHPLPSYDTLRRATPCHLRPRHVVLHALCDSTYRHCHKPHATCHKLYATQHRQAHNPHTTPTAWLPLLPHSELLATIQLLLPCYVHGYRMCMCMCVRSMLNASFYVLCVTCCVLSGTCCVRCAEWYVLRAVCRFEVGLAAAASCTGGWVVTGGTDPGVIALVREALHHPTLEA